MKIVVAGNYGAGNLGDELILEGMIKTLKEIDPEVNLTILSANPDSTTAKFSVRSLHKFPAGFRSFLSGILGGNLKQTSKVIRECDAFILGGGGLFDPSSKKGIVIWTLQALPVILKKKPLIMYGQNLPKIQKGLIGKLINYVFGKAILVALRDDELPENLNTTCKMPDLIFKSQPKNHEPSKESVIFALRDAPSVNKNHLQQIARFINFIQDQNKDLKVEFVPFEKATDEKLIEFILPLLAEKDRIIVHEYTENRSQIEKIFISAKAVMGMRLHSILMAINTGTPFIAFNYNPKVSNILSSMHLKNFMVDMKEMDMEKIRKLFEEIMGNHDEIQAKILGTRDVEIEKFKNAEEALKKALKL